MSIELLQTGILQGLILAIVAFGIMIPFRFLNFPDLTAEGACPLGGAICASLIAVGVPQLLAICLGVLGGGLLAVATAQAALRLRINSLLAGIILSTMAYSINLRIMGKPNISLFGHDLFTFNMSTVALIILACVGPFLLFLSSDFGLRFRAIGLNPKLSEKQGIGIFKYTSFGLFMAGGLFGLAGSLIVQVQQFMDVGMGVGIVIHGLASLMLGEVMVGNKNTPRQLAAPIIGALVYQQIQGVALALGLAPSDLRFFTGAIVLLVLALSKRSTN